MTEKDVSYLYNYIPCLRMRAVVNTNIARKRLPQINRSTQNQNQQENIAIG